MASTTNNNYVDPARLSSLVRDFYSTGNYPTELDTSQGIASGTVTVMPWRTMF